MNNFLFIFTNVIVPVFLQIGLGYVIRKKFEIDAGALVKIQIYACTPALLFVNIYKSNVEGSVVLSIISFGLLLFFALFLISSLIVKLKKYPKTLSKAFVNSVCFFNGGNFTLPVINLLYNDPYAISIQVICIMAQNITFNTIGVFNASSGKRSTKEALLSILKMPMGYSILIAFILNYFNIKLWVPVYSALEILGQGMIPVALLLLGIQLANTKINFKSVRVYLSNFVRLIMGPVIAYFLTLILGLHGLVAQVLIIAAAAPTAVNTVILALEFDNEPDFASQTCFSATVLSSITVTMVIFLVTRFV